MDTLLFIDQPNIELYVDLAIRDVVSVQNEMMDDIDSPEDWYNEKEEAKTFDECLKESLVHLMFEVSELIHIMRYLHEETHCSFRLAYRHGRKRLMEYYSDTQGSTSSQDGVS